MPDLVVQVSAYYPPHKGGVEVVVQKSADHLAATDQAVRVITSSLAAEHKPHHVRSRRHPAFEVIRLPSFEILHTPLLWGLVRQLRKIPQGSIIHAHIAQAFTPDIAFWVARRRKLPFIAHYHLDVSPSGKAGFLLPWYQKTILRHTLRGAGHVIVPSLDYASMVRTTYDIPPHKISVVPNATDFSIAKSPKKLPGISHTIKLLSVGRLASQKNHQLLIGALREFTKRWPAQKVRLDIYGEGDQRSALQTLIDDSGLSEVIALHRGNLPQSTMEKVYAEADVFILATRKESFGIVYVEAMAKGLPIITINLPGVRNIVKQGRNGLLCGADPDALAEQLHSLIHDPQTYRTISAQNLQDAAHYTWSAVAESLQRIYHNASHAHDQALSSQTAEHQEPAAGKYLS